MQPRSVVLALIAGSIALLVPVAVAPAAPDTTVARTIQDCDGDNLLEFAPGEGHLEVGFGSPPPAEEPSDESCPRDDEGETPRLPRRASILNFLHLSDFQVVDEESPARVEFLDFTQRPPGPTPFSSAYRPQESLTTQVTEAMVRNARNTTSPVTGARLDFSILTGDNADSQQYNEIRWFIDILDGTTGDGGENPDPEMSTGDGTSDRDRKIVPDSGIAADVPACDFPPGLSPADYQDNGSIYDGVRDDGTQAFPESAYYEPDSSGGDGDDGDGYSPSRSRNIRETGRDVTVRDFPGLLENAQAPFEAVGLGMPWYSGFGNHDALVQGNSGLAYFGPLGIGPEISNPAYQGVATGCVKPTRLPPGVSLTQEGLQAFFVEFARDPRQFIEDCQAKPADERAMCDTSPVVVPPDRRRCFVAKAEEAQGDPAPCSTGGFVEQHFRTTGTPVGHGFAGRPPQAVDNHDGYYAFKPRAGFRFIMLDSVTDECPIEPFCSEGSIDHPQFEWLRGQIQEAKAAGEYVMTFAHHTLRTTRLLSSDTTENPIHFGERFDRRDGQPITPSPGETLEELYCENPNVLAHVTGHEHQNFVETHECEQDVPDTPGEGKFAEVSTAAHIDWPQQARMIELVEEGGELSLVLTIVDHAGPANPGGPHPCRDDEPPDSPDPGCEAEGPAGQADKQPVGLASIGREIGYNDYQHGRGARGARADRNVIVPLGRPTPPEPE